MYICMYTGIASPKSNTRSIQETIFQLFYFLLTQTLILRIQTLYAQHSHGTIKKAGAFEEKERYIVYIIQMK